MAQIVPYAYPESRGLVGLRRDGTVLRADDYYAFNHTPTDAVAIASSGYVVAALNRDGTVFVAGPQTLYSDGFLARAEQLRDVVRIAVSEQCLFALLSDGSVTKCGAEYWDYGLDAWSGIVDIQTMVFVLVGRIVNRPQQVDQRPRPMASPWATGMELPRLSSVR